MIMRGETDFKVQPWNFLGSVGTGEINGMSAINSPIKVSEAVHRTFRKMSVLCPILYTHVSSS
jgi:hypothetical protein